MDADELGDRWSSRSDWGNVSTAIKTAEQAAEDIRLGSRPRAFISDCFDFHSGIGATASQPKATTTAGRQRRAGIANNRRSEMPLLRSASTN